MPNDFLEWHPTCHHNDNIMDKLEHLYDYDRFGRMRLLYIWGHSNEFDMANNWHVIEEFAQFVGGKEDIWYATNIEIYDYVKAYDNLQVSVERGIVHNPSAIDVWFSHEKTIHCVKAGETLYL